MLIKELLDDWEPEVEPPPRRRFKVKPVDGSIGWLPYAQTVAVFNEAFGERQWGIDRVPTRNTFDPVTISIGLTTKIRYGVLIDNGFKIVFMEGRHTSDGGFYSLEYSFGANAK